MPDPEHTREWSVSPEGGKDEQNRKLADIIPQDQVPTREYAPIPEGGPDELARGGKEFADAILATREATAEPPTTPAVTTKKSVMVIDPVVEKDETTAVDDAVAARE